jgi:hypothetical protein
VLSIPDGLDAALRAGPVSLGTLAPALGDLPAPSLKDSVGFISEDDVSLRASFVDHYGNH